MENNNTPSKEQLPSFEEDTQNLGLLTKNFIQQFYPAYNLNSEIISEMPKEDSLSFLNSFTFYKICECKIYNVEDKFAFFSEKMQKLFTTAYSINRPVCYGIVSQEGNVSLLIGIASDPNDKAVNTIISGLLPGIKLERYNQRFTNKKEKPGTAESFEKDRYVGCVCGVPSLKIDGVLQNRDISPLMRSLNGFDYTLMILCRPVPQNEIQDKINEAIRIQDECFAISKRTVSLQEGYSNGNTTGKQHNEGNGENDATSNGVNVSGAIPGALMGAAAGAAAGTIIPGLGTAVGGIGGGIVGLIVGQQINVNHSKTTGTSHTISDGYSEAITNTISSSKSLSVEMQNGFAIELMNMAKSMADRLKTGRSIGMWESVISYSSDSELASEIISGSLYREIASGIPEILPPVVFSYCDSCKYNGRATNKFHNEQLLIPKDFFKYGEDNSISSLVTSEEICGICSIPSDNTVGFEVQESKGYALNYPAGSDDKILGCVCEYDKPLPNISFGLSEDDLNKHTFVCGITGSGKTNTVKKILMSTDKPFLVIEPAKKEYRNIKTEEAVNVYTLGRPEINCLRMNPFYIPMGVSPQQHIDMLKDLFSASFAFYGPMPYILEKCLNTIYTKKGWNLTLGFHPYLINSSSKNPEELFDAGEMETAYNLKSHKYLFPTMEDLKNEIEYYINNELTYEGEVKGNVESAMKARIESLCVGAKGYMFNTNSFPDFKQILRHNTVLELEGLADDSDKAFALGLLIIYVNEFRQVDNEMDNSHGLRHLLVIEEAHRLLKNVSTEANEDLGNPKGKAVEHFTNMLAEMRSYGQGVIVAEQIPSKLAPEVIKNSSNKIVHRIVAKDDQDVIANTIGVYPQDAIYLGNSKVGYALCHKEGMTQPVIVKIDEVASNKISDVNLYNKDIEGKLFEINISIIQTEVSADIYLWAVRTLISIMYGSDYHLVYNGLDEAYNEIEGKLNLNAVALIPGVNTRKCVLQCISEKIVSLMVSGIFRNHKLLDNDFVQLIYETIKSPSDEELERLRLNLEKFYAKDPRKKAVELIAGIVVEEYINSKNVTSFIQDFSLFPDNKLTDEVIAYLEGRC